MAAAKDNVTGMSLGHLSVRDIHTLNAFSNQSEQSLKKSRSFLLQDDISTQRHLHSTVMHLQQVWQELKDREWAARCRNQQLLQQFERSQDTLREMLARTATMKTIRIEYERYLEDNSPRWQQQLKEKTQSAQKKRMEECLKVCLKSTEKQLPTSSVSQGPTKVPQKVAAPSVDSSQDDPCPPDLPPSWLTQFQNRMPCHPKGPSQILPPSSLQLQQLWWPSQNPANWAPSHPDNPYSWTFGAPRIPSCSEAIFEGTPAPEVTEETEGSRGSSSKSHFSQTLDTEPVRLLSSQAERSESSKVSGQRRREKRKKRERAQQACSDIEERSSQTSSTPSSAIVTGSSRRMKTRSSGLMAESPVIEGTPQKRTVSEGNDSESKNQPTGADSGSLESEESTSENTARPVRESERCRKESVQKHTESQAEEQESSTSDQTSTSENIVRQKEPKIELGDDEEEKQKSTTEDEDQDDEMAAETDEDQGDDEQSERQKSEVSGNTSSQDEEDEDESTESDDDDEESDGEADEDGEFDEQICDKAEKTERDSDDSIISPQENRLKKILVIPEEVSEDDGKDWSKAEASVEESNEFDDDEIEHLLAPQEPATQKKEKEQKTDEKPTALCGNVKIFQAKLDKSGSEDHESDEFDHFYD